VKNQYTPEQIKKYEDGYYPYYVDVTGKWEIKQGDYIVDYWAKESRPKSKSFKLVSEGGVWRMRAPRRISLAAKKTKVNLLDLVKEVHGLRFPDEEYKKLKACMRDYLRTTEINRLKSGVLIDVSLANLPTDYPLIFDNLAKKLGANAKRVRSARA
jgi:hypothetical protein